jgi:two-component system copper resistance phosphate regulon response regulator CusR
MKRILIVEDDDRLSGSIAEHLQKEGYRCERAYDGQAAVKFFANQSFDLVVLDINLPRLNGLDVCGEIRGKNARIPILMITAFGDIDSKMEAFDQGADDYLVKPFHLKELSAKVKIFLKRAEQAPLLPDVYDIAGLHIDPNKKLVTRENREIHLTPKEYSLLEYLVKNKNRVISKDELARNLWDDDYGVTPNTIEVYINFLRNKIDRDFSHKLLLTKPGFGYYISTEKV